MNNLCKSLLIGSLVVSAIGMQAKERTFTAACYNVDGLPAKLSFVKLNPDGPQAEGTDRISELIVQNGWDIFGVSEDFEFHNNLISHLGDYNVGKYRGTVTAQNTSAANMADTDGLCFIWKKGIEAGGERMVPWNKKFGSLTKGADECIDKGYRYYWVKFPDGFELDVYIHHMNSGSENGHNAARASQLNQLVDDILASDNKRPIIIMGDTNCRWTRDNLDENLFDRINADPRFTINDPWVDYMWDGWQPTTGSSMMVADFGNQKGEVVDKIFYINNTDANGVHLSANSYLHDDSFVRDNGVGLGDHFPIVVEFKLEDGYTAAPAPVDNGLANNKPYYLRNKRNGEFLNAGGAWGAHAMTGIVGNRVTFIKGDSEGSYAMRSSLGFISDPSNFTFGADLYMDAAKPRYFDFKAVGGTDTYAITYSAADGSLMAIGHIDGDNLASVNGVKYVEGDESMLWELVTEADLIEGLAAATEDSPMLATFLIRGYDFGVNDGENSAWKLETFSEAATWVKQETWGPNNWNYKTWVYRVYNLFIPGTDGTQGAWAVTQTVRNMPNGHYRLSCQMLTDNIADNPDGGTFTFTLNGEPVEGVKDIESFGAVTSEDAVEAFATGEYDLSADLEITDGKLEIRIKQGDHLDATAVCFDNFNLMYLGTKNGESGSVSETVADAIDANTPVTVYNIAGCVVLDRVTMQQAAQTLAPGIYIVRQGDRAVKVRL